MTLPKIHTSIVVCLFIVGLVSGRSIAAGPPTGLDVTVTNTPANPVPVTLQGSGSVTGSVAITNTSANPVPVTGTVGINPAANAVSISGTPSVSISSMPATSSGDRTSVVSSGSTTFNGVVSQPVENKDLTQFKMVKLVITAPTSFGSSHMEARVYEARSSTFILIDKFAIPDNNTGAVRFYELPGNRFSVEIINNTPGADQTFDYLLLGRTN